MLRNLKQHPADIYRNRRAKYCAIAQKHGFNKAYYILDKDRDKEGLDPRDYTGLLSELIFMEQHVNDMDLNPTLDCGDHCDFRGNYEQKHARFDVTSSLDYKYLDTYEPFQRQGKPYFIALIDTTKKRVDRIIDLNIPFCPECNGRLINTVVLGNIEYTNQGTPTQTQRVIKVCSNDIMHNTALASFEYFISSMWDEEESLREEYNDLGSTEYQEKLKQLTAKYGVNNALFFSKLIGDKIHACGHDKYIATDPDGEGYNATRLFWTTDLVDKIYPNEFEDPL